MQVVDLETTSKTIIDVSDVDVIKMGKQRYARSMSKIVNFILQIQNCMQLHGVSLLLGNLTMPVNCMNEFYNACCETSLKKDWGHGNVRGIRIGPSWKNNLSNYNRANDVCRRVCGCMAACAATYS